MYGDYRRPRKVETLLWTVTPITLAEPLTLAGRYSPNEPLTRVSHGEAKAIAVQLGARLPTATEWEWAAAGPQDYPFPWGSDPWNPARANLRDSDLGQSVVVGCYPEGNTKDGLMDMAGNVWEWTSTLIPNGGAIIKGGSYNSTVLEALTKFLNAAPVELQSPGIGFRLVKDLP